jgi:hypothetical protein
MPRRKAQDALASVGSHHTAETTSLPAEARSVQDPAQHLLIIDAGTTTDSRFIEDKRPAIQAAEVLDAIAKHKISVVAGFDFGPGMRGDKPAGFKSLDHRDAEGLTSWHLWYDKEKWTVKKFQPRTAMAGQTNFVAARESMIIELSPTGHNSAAVGTLQIVLLKALRGKSSCVQFFVNQETRRKLLDFANDFLKNPETLTVVAGDFGMGSSSLLKLCDENNCHGDVGIYRSCDLLLHRGVYQNLHLLCASRAHQRALRAHQHVVEAGQASRMMLWQFTMDQAHQASGGSHSARRDHGPPPKKTPPKTNVFKRLKASSASSFCG